jgi:hypothetical protein
MQEKSPNRVSEVRKGERIAIGGRRRRLAHRRRRIRPEMPADVRTSDEEIRRFRCVSSGRTKRKGKRRSGAFIGEVLMAI